MATIATLEIPPTGMATTLDDHIKDLVAEEVYMTVKDVMVDINEAVRLGTMGGLTEEEVIILRKAIANQKKKKKAKAGTTDSVEPGVLIDAMTRAFNIRLDAAEARILELEEQNTILATKVARMEYVLVKNKFMEYSPEEEK